MRMLRTAAPLAAIAAALVLAASSARPTLAVEQTVVVQPGDTLIGIATRSGVSVEELVSLNGLADADRILVGQVLRVVTPEPVQPPASGPGAVAAAASHVVLPGDNITGIASFYGTTVAELTRLNGLVNPNFIVPGQTLALPAPPDAVPADAVPAAGASAPAVDAPAWVAYTVRPGEHLTAIAAAHGTTIAALVEANGLVNPNFVYAGSVIRVPAPAKPATPAPAPAVAPPAMALPAASAAPEARPAAAGVSSLPMPEWMRPLVAQRESVLRLIVAEARAQGVPPSFALAVAWQESGFQQSVVSSSGAIGVMQLMPDTGEWVATSMLGEPVNIHDTASNVRAGVRLLRHYLDRYDGSRERTLAAYFQGQYAADNYGLYGETYPYIASILLHERFFAD